MVNLFLLRKALKRTKPKKYISELSVLQFGRRFTILTAKLEHDKESIGIESF